MSADERIESIIRAMEALKGGLEAMKGGLETMKERHDALTMRLELMSHDIEGMKIASLQDGENIRALAHIAEIHERCITDLE